MNARTKAVKVPEITDAELSLGTTKALPAWNSIPEEFKSRETKWNKLVSDLFFGGVTSLKLSPKDGVDTKAAVRAIRAHLGSWEPKHEHKESGVAYLLSQWFDAAEWSTK